jgi:hypothetical protein
MAAASCSQSETKSVPGTAVYRRRQPECAAVYTAVQGHLETRLAGCRHRPLFAFDTDIDLWLEYFFIKLEKYIPIYTHSEIIAPVFNYHTSYIFAK